MREEREGGQREGGKVNDRVRKARACCSRAWMASNMLLESLERVSTPPPQRCAMKTTLV